MRKTRWWWLPMFAMLAACSSGIKLDGGGGKVKTAWTQDVSGCRLLGKIKVSVTDHVGFFDRSDIKVRDELEVMARNEAYASLHADTVKPLGDPNRGEQLWGAYRCGAAGAKDAAGEEKPSAATAADGSSDGLQTFPVKGG